MKAAEGDCYDDFAAPTRTRKDRVRVQGELFFVNVGFLAEFSDFFADHSEDRAEIQVEGVSAAAFLELLRVMFHCPKRKPIREWNLVDVVNAACFFGVSAVLRRCEEVIQVSLPTLSHAELMQLTQTISKFDRDNASLSLLVDRIARFNDNELSTLPFAKIPGDVVADVYTLRQLSERRELRRRAKQKKRFWSSDNLCCFF